MTVSVDIKVMDSFALVVEILIAAEEGFRYQEISKHVPSVSDLLFSLNISGKVDVNMNTRQGSLISLASSDNDFSGAETGSDCEEPIVMRWVSNGNKMLARALSRKESLNGNRNRLSYTRTVPCDPRIAKLKERLEENEKLLYQLENMEKSFLGTDTHSQDTTIFRMKFEATVSRDYFLVPGCAETLIPAGKTVTILGQLQNKRWRCVVENDDHHNNNIEKSSKDVLDLVPHKNGIEKTFHQSSDSAHGQNIQEIAYCYPLIGSIPSSIIAELNEDNTDAAYDGPISVCKDTNTDTAHGEKYEEYSECTEDTNSSLCECGRHLPTHSRLPSCSLCQYCTSSSPLKLITPEHLEQLNFQRFSSVSSIPLPTLPESPTESTIAELNKALESLAKLTPRSRPVSGGSDTSRNSWTSRL